MSLAFYAAFRTLLLSADCRKYLFFASWFMLRLMLMLFLVLVMVMLMLLRNKGQR